MTITSIDPSTGETLARLEPTSATQLDAAIEEAFVAYVRWRSVPAPARAALVRALGERVRAEADRLAELVTREVGKIPTEARGEVQEVIDICEFAAGLGRTLPGSLFPSERPDHRLFEQWHPLGPIAVITAFNFPMAVWAWNAALAVVCGDAVVWKPSPLAPLCALELHRIAREVADAHGARGLFQLVLGGRELGQALADDRRLPLVSFTGSVAAGREVAVRVAGRLGRSLLELGGNNAAIVLDDADLDIAVRAVLFGAFGTAGQRCTSTRRLFLSRDISRAFLERFLEACAQWRVGNPRDPGVLCGPLIRPTAVDAYRRALERGIALGGRVLHGGRALERPGFFVEPAVVLAPSHARFEVAWEETFAPILWVFEVDSLEEAIAANNAVSQGLSSALFTTSLRATWRFLGPDGSDCGLANVNTSTSGAEIGGAFGGEKDTGGGREAGSDAWKAYMRRQTVTLNHGTTLPLAQGIQLGWTGG